VKKQQPAANRPSDAPELDHDKIDKEWAEWKAAQRGGETAAAQQAREQRQAAGAAKLEKLQATEAAKVAAAAKSGHHDAAADLEAGGTGVLPPALWPQAVAVLPLAVRVGFRLKLLTLVFFNAVGIAAVAGACAFWPPAVAYVDESRTAYNVLSLAGFGSSLVFLAMNKVGFVGCMYTASVERLLVLGFKRRQDYRFSLHFFPRSRSGSLLFSRRACRTSFR
jgi:hypothetical protein